MSQLLRPYRYFIILVLSVLYGCRHDLISVQTTPPIEIQGSWKITNYQCLLLDTCIYSFFLDGSWVENDHGVVLFGQHDYSILFALDKNTTDSKKCLKSPWLFQGIYQMHDGYVGTIWIEFPLEINNLNNSVSVLIDDYNKFPKEIVFQFKPDENFSALFYLKRE